MKTLELTDEEYELILNHRKNTEIKTTLTFLKVRYKKLLHLLRGTCNRIEEITKKQEFFDFFFENEDQITFEDLQTILKEYEG